MELSNEELTLISQGLTAGIKRLKAKVRNIERKEEQSNERKNAQLKKIIAMTKLHAKIEYFRNNEK